MALIELELTRRDRYAGGRSFGDIGPYVIEHGRATYAVDPSGPDGAAIVDLERAPVDELGRVVFTGDIRLLRPLMTERSAGVGLLDVVNRGNPLLEPFVNRFDRQPGVVGEPGPGDGFVFERGWTVLGVGWQYDLIDHPVLNSLDVPLALGDDGQPLSSEVTVEIAPATSATTLGLAALGHTSRPPVGLDDPGAELLVATHQHGPWATVPRETWSFARETDRGLVPSGRHVHLPAGFEVGSIYSVRYRTNETPVGGVGLLAIRDAARWLRSTPGVDSVIGFGASQSGRLLRHLCATDLNEKDAFDGLLIHIAGARRGEFNDRHGSPGNLFRPSSATVAPFGPELFDPLRLRGVMPKTILSNTSTEYWRGDASLCHTDLDGTTDLSDTNDVRLYHHRGTQHSVSPMPQTSVEPLTGAAATHGFNVTDNRILLRAELVALVDWVTRGVEPPPSCHPTLADESLATRESVVEAFGGRELGRLDPASLPTNGPYELGADQDVGIIAHPVTPADGPRYRPLVPAVDDDGHERGGVAVPSVVVPVARHTGWNTRAGITILHPLRGSSVFLSPDEMTERYGDRSAYLSLVAAAAEELIADRRLLAEDREIAVSAAADQWDAVIAGDVV